MSEIEGLTFSEKLEDKLHRTGQFQQILGFLFPNSMECGTMEKWDARSWYTVHRCRK